MGLSAFLARDVIQYILPTIIALGLFFPIFDQNITADYIVFGGALIGYFISSFVGYFAGWLLVLTVCTAPTEDARRSTRLVVEKF